MYREDVVESAYAMALIRGLQTKHMYEGLDDSHAPGRRLTQQKLDRRRFKARLAKAARKAQRR